MQQGGAQTVLADPQFGILRTLRPYVGFEAVYEGENAGRPIMLTERIDGTGGEPRDASAVEGIEGVSPNLIRGLSVGLGSRVIFWIPNIYGFGNGERDPYIFTVIWRARNIRDTRIQRVSYMFPDQGLGVPDTTAPVGQQQRTVIPASYQPIHYSAAQPTSFGNDAIVETYREAIRVQSEPPGELPLMPDGTDGEYQQGLLDPGGGFGNAAVQPLYLQYELQAVGTELLVAVTRDTNVGATWEFAGADSQFSDLLGNGQGQAFPNIGVYVSGGVAP